MTKQIEMTFEEWDAKYDPIDNPYDDRTQRIETFGEELEFVKSNGSEYVWTEFDDGTITNGYHFVNRSCYYVTLIPCEEDTFYNIIGPDSSDCVGSGEFLEMAEDIFDLGFCDDAIYERDGSWKSCESDAVAWFHRQPLEPWSEEAARDMAHKFWAHIALIMMFE